MKDFEVDLDCRFAAQHSIWRSVVNRGCMIEGVGVLGGSISAEWMGLRSRPSIKRRSVDEASARGPNQKHLL